MSKLGEAINKFFKTSQTVAVGVASSERASQFSLDGMDKGIFLENLNDQYQTWSSLLPSYILDATSKDLNDVKGKDEAALKKDKGVHKDALTFMEEAVKEISPEEFAAVNIAELYTSGDTEATLAAKVSMKILTNRMDSTLGNKVDDKTDVIIGLIQGQLKINRIMKARKQFFTAEILSPEVNKSGEAKMRKGSVFAPLMTVGKKAAALVSPAAANSVQEDKLVDALYKEMLKTNNWKEPDNKGFLERTVIDASSSGLGNVTKTALKSYIQSYLLPKLKDQIGSQVEAKDQMAAIVGKFNQEDSLDHFKKTLSLFNQALDTASSANKTALPDGKVKEIMRASVETVAAIDNKKPMTPPQSPAAKTPGAAPVVQQVPPPIPKRGPVVPSAQTAQEPVKPPPLPPSVIAAREAKAKQAEQMPVEPPPLPAALLAKKKEKEAAAEAARKSGPPPVPPQSTKPKTGPGGGH